MRLINNKILIGGILTGLAAVILIIFVQSRSGNIDKGREYLKGALNKTGAGPIPDGGFRAVQFEERQPQTPASSRKETVVIEYFGSPVHVAKNALNEIDFSTRLPYQGEIAVLIRGENTQREIFSREIICSNKKMQDDNDSTNEPLPGKMLVGKKLIDLTDVSKITFKVQIPSADQYRSSLECNNGGVRFGISFPVVYPSQTLWSQESGERLAKVLGEAIDASGFSKSEATKAARDAVERFRELSDYERFIFQFEPDTAGDDINHVTTTLLRFLCRALSGLGDTTAGNKVTLSGLIFFVFNLKEGFNDRFFIAAFNDRGKQIFDGSVFFPGQRGVGDATDAVAQFVWP